LRKEASLRPSYDKLAVHPWLAPLLQPPTISEDAEAEAEAEAAASGTTEMPTTFKHADALMNNSSADTADEEVATWVKQQLDKRKAGTLKKTEAPALHTAPLDAVPSPKEV
jgi:mitogen-activated protein kinase kinase